MKTLEINRPVKDFARANDKVHITAITKKNEIIVLGQCIYRRKPKGISMIEKPIK